MPEDKARWSGLGESRYFGAITNPAAAVKPYPFFSLLLLFFACTDSGPAPVPYTAAGVNEELIEEYGADAYGMKPYVMAFLRTGPNRSPDSTAAAELQRAHLENIERMAEAGDLVLAGPFLDEGELRGIYVFNVATVEEARALTASDPAVRAGTLVMELHSWYGSAGLMGLNELHRTLESRSPSQ
ncbi:YciI family protein [Neolewinella litorea]|uniref:YCII-related domain-containing protein n=1 Tax=Neolewinella litorea TaxID=2562452 RepID=A0A4S4NL98_9BACT|nr:YciI family protein [Neolewinella litorea]THH40659.1 hypothetical protein E4021_07985 [Neolewinella litorea]